MGREQLLPSHTEGILKLGEEQREKDAKFDALMKKMTEMGMNQKTHADQVSETLGEVNVNMATMSANVQNIKEKNTEDRKEIRDSITKIHERVDKVNGQLQAHGQAISNHDDRIGEISVKTNDNEDRIVSIESRSGIKIPTNGLSTVQLWAIIIGAVVTLGTAVITAYVTLRTSDKPPIVAPENP